MFKNSENFTTSVCVPPKSNPEVRIWEAQMSNGENVVGKGEREKKERVKEQFTIFGYQYMGTK